MQLPPERLGSFYLGAKFDLHSGSHTSISLNYDARDLTTHAVCRDDGQRRDRKVSVT
jgi:hypothetical protein